ncbi:MAG: 50S ribosomal protein L4 [bacterium]
MENTNGKKVTRLKKGLIVEALRIEQANTRRGTAKQKNRAEVSGGGVKPWRQKGTGRARQGSIRAVQWRGGGRAFGDALENYSLKMNKKARKAAVESVLQWKLAEGRIVVAELAFDEPSTKKFRAFLDDKEMTGKVLYMYEGDGTANVIKSARNLQGVKCIHADRLNIKDLLDREWLLVSPATAERLKINNA